MSLSDRWHLLLKVGKAVDLRRRRRRGRYGGKGKAYRGGNDSGPDPDVSLGEMLDGTMSFDGGTMG